MTHEQFTFWLKGYLEAKGTLTDSDTKIIKDKMDSIVNPAPFTFEPYITNPVIQPYEFRRDDIMFYSTSNN
jgi:hypothetical protein